jgi:hypothetical protein
MFASDSAVVPTSCATCPQAGLRATHPQPRTKRPLQLTRGPPPASVGAGALLRLLRAAPVRRWSPCVAELCRARHARSQNPETKARSSDNGRRRSLPATPDSKQTRPLSRHAGRQSLADGNIRRLRKDTIVSVDYRRPSSGMKSWTRHCCDFLRSLLPGLFRINGLPGSGIGARNCSCTNRGPMPRLSHSRSELPAAC